MRAERLCTALIFVSSLSPHAATAQTSAVQPPSVLADQRQASLEITDIDYGVVALGTGALRATISNLGDTALVAVLDVRAMPGMWLIPNMQRQFGFDLGPQERRQVEVPYEFRRMSPEAVLRVRLGPGHRSPEGNYVQDSISSEHRYPVGVGNPAALDIDRYFQLERRGSLEIYAWRGSLAAERIDEIARERSAAIRSLQDILAVSSPDLVRLVFYPDSASKSTQTGHIGLGWAFGTTIVEIYNEDVQLDPFHELAHVLAGEIGQVPAMFDEGFAVYASERLGSDALRHLGSPGSSLDEAACRFLSEGSAFALGDLSALDHIGSTASRPEVAYPQAGSVVKYLIDAFGAERFRALYRALAAEQGDPEQRTAAALARVLGASLADVEAGWQASVAAACR